MQSGLGTITIGDDEHSGHVAYELGDRDGLLFAGEELLHRAKAAKSVTLAPLSTPAKHKIRIGTVEASCANFLVLPKTA
jgi:hypothetical protein